MASHGKTVLSFHDSLLRESDVATLNAGCWLNDKVIGFAFEYFERELFAPFQDQVAFLSPEVTQMLKFISDADAAMHLEALNLHSKQLVFMAVNDCDSAEASGGCHWSTVIFDRSELRFLHFDSYGGHNAHAADVTSQKIKSLLKAPLDLPVALCDMPQQTNTCDCGVYVVAVVDYYCRSALQKEELDLFKVLDPIEVKKKRTEMKDLIKKLSAKSS